MAFSSQFSRRVFVKMSGASIASLALGSSALNGAANLWAAADTATARVPLNDVLPQLMAGNARFVKGDITHPRRKPEDFQPLAAGQNPFAIIVGCADSRVAPEVLFDQGIGDLFVIRVAGNYIEGAGAAVKGSVEYAVAELGVQLVMVLGHSQCGAVKAAIQHIHDKDALPGSINTLVNAIKPAVLASEGKPGDALDNAIRANVQRSVQRAKTLEPILEPKIKKGEVKVVGAVYDLASGKVTLVD
jgi:carbonic anhydrase